MKKTGVIVFLLALLMGLFTASCIKSNEDNVDKEIKAVPVVRQIAPKPQSEEGQTTTTPKSQPEHAQEQLPNVIESTPPIPVEIIPEEVPALPQPKVSLDIKIGQMLIVGFRGFSVNAKSPIVWDIQKFHLGGVILFDYDITLKSSKRNIKSPKQVKKLVNSLQAASNIPLFIAIDQEGGKVQRLKNKFGFPYTVSAQYLGKKNNLELTYKHATKMAKTLASLGINFNFAPVVDLNTNPNNPVIGKLKRSFSANPKIVTNHALEFIRAHNEHGVLCILKHFPGHGSSTKDSHLGLVDVTNTWKNIELFPYKEIISAGMADAIMTAHVFNRHYDPTHPATLSKRIVGGVLRTDLRYDGVIVSDDMQMKAITSHYSFEYAIQATLEAGIDIIIIGNNLKYEEDIVARTVVVIKQLIQDGKLSEKRIDESYRRIQTLKHWLATRP